MYGVIYFLQNAAFLGRPLQSEPGFIVRPIAWLFGTILSFLFDIVYWMTTANSLGFAIILLTIVAMVIMLPLGIKSQKSMMKMQQLNPEIEKIKAKYGNKNDQETKQKIAAETQALWAKHKVNPLGSCLPMLVQMPLFFALMYIMNQSYLYIDVLNQLYYEIAEAILAVPNYFEILEPIVRDAGIIPRGWEQNADELRVIYHGLVNIGWEASPETMRVAIERLGTTDVIVLGLPESLSRVLDRFNVDTWNTMIAQIPTAHAAPIQALYDRLHSMEAFFGLPLKNVSGWRLPGILIPILAVITTLITSWLTQQVNKGKNDQMKTQQTVMMVVMPLFMGGITVGMPAGVGLYWITMNIFRLVQQLIMNKKAGVEYQLPFRKKEA